jgi:hypothetical protein
MLSAVYVETIRAQAIPISMRERTKKYLSQNGAIRASQMPVDETAADPALPFPLDLISSISTRIS